MTRTKLGLLGLCAMALSLMAFSATAANAEVGAEWRLAEAAPNSGLITFLEAEIELEVDNPKKEEYPYVLHSEILKIKTLFLCKSLKIAGNPKLQSLGHISSGKVLFSGCLTDLNGTKNANCTPKDATDGEGTVVTNSLDSLIVLHEGEHILRLLPVSGETFATIEMGAACPIGTKVPVIGELSLQDCNKLALTHEEKHLVEPFGPLTKLWTISKTVEHVATLLGSAWGFLKGAHEHLKFSAHTDGEP